MKQRCLKGCKRVLRHSHVRRALKWMFVIALLALAFGIHESAREGVAFALADMATAPLTEKLWARFV